MSYVDDDDLFDEASDRGTRPPRSRSRAGGSRSGGGGRGRQSAAPRRPAPRGGGGGASALQQRGVRLAILAGLVLVVLLVLITSVRSCQRDRLVSTYRSYLTAANGITGESQQLGSELQNLLENKQFKAPVQVAQDVKALATRASDLVTRGKKLAPPDPLKAPNNTLITVLEYRRDGLRELGTAIEGTGAGGNNDLANQMASLVEPIKALGASDVIFKRSFLGPVQSALKADSIKDVQVTASYMYPDSTFDDASQTGIAKILSALKQVKTSGGTPSTGGGSSTGDKHGVNIQSVFAVANGNRIQLSQGSTVTVPASSDLKFEVTVEDGGDFNEFNVPVTFTYTTPSDTKGTTQTETIPTIEQGAANAQKVTFRISSPYVRDPSTITVKAGPVQGETKTDNNQATYQVQFQVSG